MKLFLDTNVLIDFLMMRAPFYEPAAMLVSYASEKRIEICVSALSIVTANFICVEKCKFPKEQFWKRLNFLRAFTSVTPIDSDVVDEAADSEWSDFEDSVQYHSALGVGVDYIVTRNEADFKDSSIPVVSPDEACLRIL